MNFHKSNVVLASLLITLVAFTQKEDKIAPASTLVGCWNTVYERCTKPDDGTELTIVKISDTELMGYYKTGGGYMIGKFSAGGKTWKGRWYSKNCNQKIWCQGTFSFKLTASATFSGSYTTDKGCPNLTSYCPDKKTSFYWNGTRAGL